MTPQPNGRIRCAVRGVGRVHAASALCEQLPQGRRRLRQPAALQVSDEVLRRRRRVRPQCEHGLDPRVGAISFCNCTLSSGGLLTCHKALPKAPLPWRGWPGYMAVYLGLKDESHGFE